MLFVLVWFSCAWFGSWEFNPNNSTRLFAAISLAEDGDATIDEFAPLTIDKAQFGDHFYLDKAPGMTLMAVPIVAAVNAVTGERSASVPKAAGDPDLTRFLRLRLRIVAGMTSALLTAIAAVLLYDLALGLTESAGAALFAALGYALGSPIWGWSTTMFGHAAVAALYVIALWAVWRATRDAESWPGWALLVGVVLGWAVVVEYQAVLAGSAIALLGAWRSRKRPDRWQMLVAAATGGIVALLPLLGYNLLAFGTPFRVGYSGVVGFAGMNQGLFGLTMPKPDVLWQILFGLRRGIIWVAPILILAPVGLASMAAGHRLRAIGIAVTAAAAIVLLVNAAYVYWDGGHSTGPRHAMPAVGMLALGLAVVWTMLPNRAARAGAAALLALSIALNAVIAAADTTSPDTFTDPIRDHIFKERLMTGWLTDIPGEYWGWTAWHGFVLYVGIALFLLSLTIRAARLADLFNTNVKSSVIML